MDKPITIETSFPVFSERVRAKATSIGARAFYDYAEDAMAAAAGIYSVIGLIRRDSVDRDSDDAPRLSDWDVDNLLGLAQFAALSLQRKADWLGMWADKHFVDEVSE